MPASGAPLGSTPFGFGTPVAAPIAATEGPALVRFINSGSGDYELNSATGQFKKMPSTRQRVLLIAKTEFGSATAAPRLGIFRPKKIDQAFEANMRTSVKIAFRRLTDVEKIMRIDRIDIEKLSTGRAEVTVIYTDFLALTPDDLEQSFATVI